VALRGLEVAGRQQQAARAKVRMHIPRRELRRAHVRGKGPAHVADLGVDDDQDRMRRAHQQLDDLDPTRRVLPNGLTVLAKETRTTPAITIYAGFHAGTLYDPIGCAGVAHFVSKTIDRGTTSRTAEQIADELENRGVSLSVALNRHAMWLVCTCLSEDFEQVLAIVGDVAMRPVFPESEVEMRRGEIVTLLRQDQDNPASVAMEALMFAFDVAADGTPIAGARLIIEATSGRELDLTAVEVLDEPQDR